jgi:prevent-host-death family protein
MDHPVVHILRGVAVKLRADLERKMRVSLSDAEAQLTELVRRAEEGDEVILTRDGQSVVRLVPVRKAHNAESRRAVLDKILASPSKATPGPDAARSQDFLYDEYGLPR